MGAANSHKVSLSLVFLAVLFGLISGQNSAQDYVNAHTTPRAQVGVGSVTWDTTLATYAQNYANQMKITCSTAPSNGPYGENIAKGGSATFTGAVAVSMWAAEAQYYDYNTNTCTGGGVCHHYTQVVWASSVRIGCARVLCNNGWYYVICSYDPPGNVPGVRPY